MSALIVWLPLFLTLAMCLSLVAFALLERTKINQLCVLQMVQLQIQLRKKLIALEKLNPKAASLRNQRMAAETRLKIALASGVAPIIAQAQAQLLYVIGAQLQLKSQQQQLLTESRLLRNQTKQETDWKLRAQGAVPLRANSTGIKALAVQAVPPLSLSPNYLPLPQFRQVQAEHTNYRINIFRKVPQWILKHFKVSPWQNAQCGASLKGIPGRWSLTLSAAK